METSFCWSVVSNIYVYKWECNYNVIKSFCLSFTSPACNLFCCDIDGKKCIQPSYFKPFRIVSIRVRVVFVIWRQELTL